MFPFKYASNVRIINVEGIFCYIALHFPLYMHQMSDLYFLSHEFCHFRDAPNRRTPSRRIEVCIIDGGLKRNYFKSLAMYREKRTERFLLLDVDEPGRRRRI